MTNTICSACPGKMRSVMRIDTGVKKAIAYRLRFLLEDVIEDYYASKRNYFLQESLTQTQKDNLERRFRKEINALRIVIAMCASHQQRTELPSWFSIIPVEDEQKRGRPKKVTPVYPKPNQKTSKDTGLTGH